MFRPTDAARGGCIVNAAPVVAAAAAISAAAVAGIVVVSHGVNTWKFEAAQEHSNATKHLRQHRRRSSDSVYMTIVIR